MSAQDVSLNVSRAFVRQIDAVIHNNLKRFIERAISEDKNFTEADKKDQVAKLEEYGKEYLSQNKPQIDPNMLPYGNQYKKARKRKPRKMRLKPVYKTKSGYHKEIDSFG
jgi:DNA-binding protein H-NS